ncbi:MAG: hypothetical protein JSR91_16905 [Proteobacteria bacterium]|nr:hypothetical protein [Pseudomonadota bacterium]
MIDCAQKSARQPVEVNLGAFREPFRKLAQLLERIAEAEVSEQARDEAQKQLTEADALVERLGEVKAASIAGRSGLEQSIRARPWVAVGLAAAAGFLAASVLQRRPS